MSIHTFLESLVHDLWIVVPNVRLIPVAFSVMWYREFVSLLISNFSSDFDTLLFCSFVSLFKDEYLYFENELVIFLLEMK